MFSVRVKKERCKGCRLCIEVCPANVFSVSQNFNRMGVHYVEAKGEGKNICTGCQRCVIICPDVAIEILKTTNNTQGGEDEDRGNT